MKVPFLDLKAQYTEIKDEIDAALQGVLDKTAFAGGPFVAAFEDEFAAYCGVPHACGVGSGTDALWFALLALGIGPGDEVITVPNTFIATAEAISFTGARPVFVDVDEQTHTLDPALLEAAVTPRTKAVVPVHLYGQPADMDPIMAIARKHGLRVIEDACQAHGAEYKGRRTGSIGDAGCFSFYPGKNLGAYGEAGAVTTSSEETAAAIRILRDHGQPRKYMHAKVGWNGRMDGFQGAVLSVKLKRLDEGNTRRRVHAEQYRSLLEGVDGVELPREADYAKHVYHVFWMRTPEREALMDRLKARDIGCGIHYPVPVHLQEAYAEMGQGKGDYPVTEAAADSLVSLPMFPELTPEQIEYVAGTVKEWAARDR